LPERFARKIRCKTPFFFDPEVVEYSDSDDHAIVKFGKGRKK
jgi:hypothetical protein